MIPVEKARETILEHVRALPEERVSFTDALGRYLAEDVRAESDIPSFTNSAMDGYAVRTEDVQEPGVCLSVAGIVPAGMRERMVLPPRHAMKIMTGAPLPEGADAVVKREDTREEQGRVWIDKVPQKDENIRFRGEDIPSGSIVLSRGELLGPAALGVLASINKNYVYVSQRPSVAVLATGDEIVEPGIQAEGPAVISSNSFTITALVKDAGGIPVYLGIAKDSVAEIQSALSRAMRCDVVITTGGVSVGDFDFVRRIMEEKGNRIIFWGVEMKPGKPVAFGTVAGKPLFGLPGNTVSAMTAFYQFVRPALLKMQGAQSLLLPRIRARLKAAVKSSGDRPHYMRGVLAREQDELTVSPTGPQGSGILSSMARGNCFFIIPKGTKWLEAGQWVECEVYSWWLS